MLDYISAIAIFIIFGFFVLSVLIDDSLENHITEMKRKTPIENQVNDNNIFG